MSDGPRKKTWQCIGCFVRAFSMDGEAIPEPRKWADSRCPKCRVDHALKEGGKSAAKGMEEKLGLGRRKFRKPPPPRPPSETTSRRREEVRETVLAHPDWNAEQIGAEIGIPARSASRIRTGLGLARSRKKEISPEDLARVEDALGGPIRSDDVIGKDLDLPPAVILKVREQHGIPGPRERRKIERLEAVADMIRDHPTWTNDELANSLGVHCGTVKKDRRELGLTPRKLGQRLIPAA